MRRAAAWMLYRLGGFLYKAGAEDIGNRILMRSVRLQGIGRPGPWKVMP